METFLYNYTSFTNAMRICQVLVTHTHTYMGHQNRASRICVKGMCVCVLLLLKGGGGTGH
jgi:hypothetical protein